MTIKQYQTVAKTIANKINDLGGNPANVRNLKFPSKFTIGARNPKMYKGMPCTFESGDGNVEISFDAISNPNNPNYKFRTLKPGSMSAYDSEANVNVDLSEFNYDSAQFADLIDAISTTGWEIAR